MSQPSAAPPAISILFLTLNEEDNIEAAIASVAGFEDIVVLDSFSTDATVELAKKAGARVVQRRFDNWAAHQNWALANIEFRHSWVFYLDADERMTPELDAEIREIASRPDEERVGFYCGRRNFFMGRWIKHCYPAVPILRFFKPPFITYERLVNPIAHVRGEVGELREQFIHYNFSKGLTEWIDKHNKYSWAEAKEAIQVMDNRSASIAGVFQGDKAQRRAALKRLSWHMPFRPALKFLYLYIFKLGFLDGSPGYIYCRLQAIYEYFIALKVKEIRMQRRGIKL